MKILLILFLSLNLFAIDIDVLANTLLDLGIDKEDILDDSFVLKLEKQQTPEAYTILAITLIEGKIINKDIKKAIFLLTKASEKNYAKADYLLGLLYEDNIEIQQNYDLAELFYKRASINGNANASYNLAILYHFGENGDLETRVNHKKALMYYKKSLQQGNETSFLKKSISELEGIEI